jgi:DNA segregation ATPase FtsK/SpoIIIE-like protein
MLLALRMIRNPLVLVASAIIIVGASYAMSKEAGSLNDYWRIPAEDLIRALGAGGVAIFIWLAAVGYLLFKRALTLVRRWRWVLGSGLFFAGVAGVLGYFEAPLPLVDTVNLGGEFGAAVQGDDGLFAVMRIGVLLIAGVYIIVPALTRATLRNAGRGGRKTAAGSAQAYRAVPLHKGASRLLGIAWRGGTRSAQKANEYRQTKQEESFARKVGDFLNNSSGGLESERHGLHFGVDEIVEDESHDLDPSETVTSEAQPPEPKRQKTEVLDPPEPEPEPVEVILRKVARGSWALPHLALLAPPVIAGITTEYHHETARLIEETLGQHGVEVRVAEIRPGPSVTMFGLVPGWNRKQRSAARGRESNDGAPEAPLEAKNRVKVDAIIAREKDLALALAAPSLRLEAPVPGESVVGVEVPNKSSTMVTLRSVMESDEYMSMVGTDKLPVALGLATAGEPIAIDLLKMPHLLIAGATGSGKSVCINAIISSIITHQPPSKVRLLLVDPKRVELTPYNGIPHLVTPVVVEPDRVVRLLRGAIGEMLRRYKLLEEAGVRNIESYNRSPKAVEDLPYFVICIDELADLMMTSSFDVEASICRLAQLGRAVGIHLIVATQRPSVDVVTGLIKANFPSRIAFAVASQVDSRTILDSVGAERLLGRGDMLFLSADSPKAKRVQGVFISDEETERLGDYWRSHPEIGLPEIPLDDLAREAEMQAVQKGLATEAGMSSDNDSLYDRAMQLATSNRALSTSLLQRRLRIGYPRAARLMDQLEDEGVIAPTSEPGKPRPVLLKSDE